MATLGTYKVDCPTCSKPLVIPLHTRITAASTSDKVICTLTLDRFYLHRHALTHGNHDGEPAPAEAA